MAFDSSRQQTASSRITAVSPLGWILLALMAAALATSLIDGRPTSLPAAALESAPLFYAEKAAALFAVVLLAIIILGRAFAGQLPIEIRGMKWAELRDVKDDTQEAVEALAAANEHLRRRVEFLEALDGVPTEPTRLR